MGSNRREVGCTDAIGRLRSVRVVPLQGGCVGVQAPPGEWFEINTRQLRDLLAAAREASRESRSDGIREPETTVAGS
jgi:hypothetical protein